EAILCRQRDQRPVRIDIESSFQIAGNADEWQAMYHIEIEIPKKRSVRISHEYLRVAQDAWWVGYTNNNGRVTCGAADDHPQENIWNIQGRPFLDFYR